MRRPTADETADAARILREIVEKTEQGVLSDEGAAGMLRRIEGAATGLEALDR